MTIEKLDHVNVRTTQLDTMIDWYQSVLGMRVGARPNFPFPGAWIYAGDAAVVHLVGIEGAAGTGSEVALKVEHFAFSATGLAGFEAQLNTKNVSYQRVDVHEIRLAQLNVWDPDGNHIHIDFPLDETVD